jgi:hypothetical protein
MTRRTLRVILTVGLIPLWFLGVYAGTVVDLFLVPSARELMDKDDADIQWLQPPGGELVTDVRLSCGTHCQRCSVLAATSTGHVYLYTQESGEQITFKDVTDELGTGDLPSSFGLNSAGELESQGAAGCSVQPVEQVDLDKLAALPPGNILYNGHCYIGCSEGMYSALDVAIVDGYGLWLLGYASTGGGIFPSLGHVLDDMRNSVCFSTILMTAIVIWLGGRMWSGNSRDA